MVLKSIVSYDDALVILIGLVETYESLDYPTSSMIELTARYFNTTASQVLEDMSDVYKASKKRSFS